MGYREEYYDGKGNKIRIVDTRVLSEEKDKIIERLKKISNEILAETDWMIVRKIERGIEIPEEISKFRKKILDDIESNEIKIINASTLEELDSCGWTFPEKN